MGAVVPVNGHWPSSTFCVTLFTVGVSRSDCSEMSENPRSRPPHPAKRKSIPTNTIINLDGMVAISCAGSTLQRGNGSTVGLGEKRMEVARLGAVRRALRVSINARLEILSTKKRSEDEERAAGRRERKLHGIGKRARWALKRHASARRSWPSTMRGRFQQCRSIAAGQSRRATQLWFDCLALRRSAQRRGCTGVRRARSRRRCATKMRPVWRRRAVAITSAPRLSTQVPAALGAVKGAAWRSWWRLYWPRSEAGSGRR
jgi:hypothetical protein